MKKEQLEKTFAWFRADARRLTGLKAANLICTGFTYVAFCVVVALGFWRREPMTLRLVLTCGISFVLLTAARALLDQPRPYEVYNMVPLLKKDTQGKSFPSRHVFSIFVIGTSFLYITPWLGVTLLALGVILAGARVLSGVHFARDVLVGAALGGLAAVVGFSVVS